ncbi:MAG TPA: hypothetical protein IAA56_03740 [Candidatus Galloscillospira excrementavium]|nr:hypothetical protein [Candidatus Galloscillospira excrementavium]
MPNPEEHFSRYCDQVCAHVRFRPDHPAIRAELMAHLEDRYRAILDRQPNLPLFEAGDRAAAAMGDPAELGRALDAAHSPLLGWVQIWVHRLLCAVAAATALLIFVPYILSPDLLSSLWSRQPYDEFLLNEAEEATVVADFDCGAFVSTEDYTFTVERTVVQQRDSSLSLYCTIHALHLNPWLRNPYLDDGVWAVDDLGNRHPSWEEPDYDGTLSVWSGFSSPFRTHYIAAVNSIPAEASEITLIFDRYGKNEIYLTIPLRGGESDG